MLTPFVTNSASWQHPDCGFFFCPVRDVNFSRAFARHRSTPM
jgi:hypothetical protein